MTCTPASLAGPAAPALASRYRLRLAQAEHELHAIQRLRFEVFNLELNEGLGESFLTGRDEDAFDAVCDHLYVEDLESGRPVGTYRLQTGSVAALRLGYYSAQEFDLRPFELRRPEIVEIGRACVHAEHRSLGVLNLLWRGLVAYAEGRGGRFLLGCSSIPTVDGSHGVALHQRLSAYEAAGAWQTQPWPEFACQATMPFPAEVPALPRLLRGYLNAGAKICGPPALDRAFGVIDFLTVLDLAALPLTYRTHFARPDDNLGWLREGRSA
ncbi:MAG: GNAT family N-acetyltransferase [Verrucomicrobia bacterium]|nr:GNAT family N-acetyltransferase [Verrucomicrobiota bacterium]